MVDIKGLDKAKVLHALWHASHAQGLSFMGLNPDGFSFEHAKEIIEERQRNHQSLYFDYLEGHVIKCDIAKDTFDEFLFDRDCGPGAAQRAIDTLTANEVKERVTESGVKIVYDFTTYTNENMRALKDVLDTMVSSAQCGFENDKGVIIDPPYYMAYDDGDKRYTILKLNNLAKFTVNLPSIPAEKDSDMFTVSPDNTFLPYNVCVYMREDDDVLNMPEMSHLGAKHVNDILELLEYLKQKVLNYNKITHMFKHVIYTHDEYVCVNRDACGIIKKDKPEPKTVSIDIRKPDEDVEIF